MADKIDPSHEQKRSLLRFVGPLILVIGLIFSAIGLVSFFSAFGGSGPPKMFWCAFVGLPLIWLGITLSSAGFIGAVQRYMAGESVPVAKDTVNYLAEETKQSVKTIATAIGEGLAAGREGGAQASIACPKCNQANSPDARFCKVCGAAFAATKQCSSCDKLNGADATFCDHCGAKLTS